MVNPYRHREMSAAEALNLTWADAYGAERRVKEDLEAKER